MKKCKPMRPSMKERKIHGGITLSEYRSWRGMRSRCYDTTHHNYKNYGARGISVCDRWVTSFANFLDDMGLKPSREHTLGRIDNDGDYTPENCRWETVIQQMNNRSDNLLITIDSDTRTAAEWAREKGIRLGTICQRIRLGWDPVQAVTTAVDKTRNGHNWVTIDGVTKYVEEWARISGIHPTTIRSRVSRGLIGPAILYDGRHKRRH